MGRTIWLRLHIFVIFAIFCAKFFDHRTKGIRTEGRKDHKALRTAFCERPAEQRRLIDRPVVGFQSTN